MEAQPSASDAGAPSSSGEIKDVDALQDFKEGDLVQFGNSKGRISTVLSEDKFEVLLESGEEIGVKAEELTKIQDMEATQDVIDDQTGSAPGETSAPSSSSAPEHVKENATDADNHKDAAVAVAREPREPSLPLPAPSKSDWAVEMSDICKTVEDTSISEEEKIRVLYDALELRVRDTRAYEEYLTSAFTRLDDVARERDHYRSEVTKVGQAKAKFEDICQELRQTRLELSQENKQVAEDAEKQHSELSEKREETLKDVDEKMEADHEVNESFCKENDDLRKKFEEFSKACEAQVEELAEKSEASFEYLEVLKSKDTEYEAMGTESKKKADQFTTQNKSLKKSTTLLRNEVNDYVKRFDDMHESVSSTSEARNEYKTEMDAMTERLDALQKENVEVKGDKTLDNLTNEQKAMKKQCEALQRLCDNLQMELSSRKKNRTTS